MTALIIYAYIQYANGRSNPWWLFLETPLKGGPSWIGSDRYTINAKAEGTPSGDTMSGPMLQALLEDRFKLKIHRETKEIPVYELTVAKGGPKLKPFKEGSCVPIDPANLTGEFPPLAAGEKRCSSLTVPKGPANNGWLVMTMDTQGISVEHFSKLLQLERPVINRTGIAGRFDFHLEYAFASGRGSAPTAPLDETSVGLSVFTVVEQLGLRLQPAKGPQDSLVIDSIERPIEN